MSKKRAGIIDLSTGQVQEVYVWVGVRRSRAFRGRSYVGNQDAALVLAKDREITGVAHSVLWYLISRLDFENYIHVPRKDICAELNLLQPQVSKAISLLVHKGVVLRGPRIGNSSVLRLNPNLGWKGGAKSHERALKERMDARGMRVVES